MAYETPRQLALVGDVSWHDWFYYDENSPSSLMWKFDKYFGNGHKVCQRRAGTPAGNTAKNGYYTVEIGHDCFFVHRLIWEMHNGPIPAGMVVDHIDGDKTNNRAENLRVVTQAENTRNAAMYKTNTSGVTGVYRTVKSRGRAYWVCQCHIKGERIFKLFSVDKLGEGAAFQAACEHRQLLENCAKEVGAGFSDRHGKPNQEVN